MVSELMGAVGFMVGGGVMDGVNVGGIGVIVGKNTTEGGLWMRRGGEGVGIIVASRGTVV